MITGTVNRYLEATVSIVVWGVDGRKRLIVGEFT